MPYYREKSDYFRKELLNTRMFESLKDELRIIQKERCCARTATLTRITKISATVEVRPAHFDKKVITAGG